jgi:hypothetical protein
MNTKSAAADTAPNKAAPLYAAASLTICADTWLAHAPDEAEQQRIDAACRQMREQRRLAVAFYQDPQAARIFSLELFRTEPFAPLHLSERLIEQILRQVGEPPVVEAEDDPAFSKYMRRAVLVIASSRVRRDLAAQLRRFLPQYVQAARWKEAIAIDNNAFRTSLGNEVSPFLVQMTLGGLVRWYDQHAA